MNDGVVAVSEMMEHNGAWYVVRSAETSLTWIVGQMMLS
jgi:hypothetical protein